MNAQKYTIESRAIKAVDRLYPGTSVSIISVWKEGTGWVDFIKVLKEIPEYIQIFRSMLEYLMDLGYTAVQLEVTRYNQRKQPVTISHPDYKLRQLIAA